jgi:hypothetical protein
MTTGNPLYDNLAIERYLDGFDRTTSLRGAHYFKSHAVLQLRCDEPGGRYSATVRGSLDYEVTLFFSEGEWDGECTCPVGYECKHIYATMLALRKNASQFPSAPPNLTVLPPASKSKKAAKSPSPPLVPASPVVTRVTKALGRPPNAKEAAFLRQVQMLFKKVNQSNGALLPYDLRLFAPALNDFGWAALDLWPKMPKDDFELWLYCAWELRRRGIDVPDFMRAATDFSVIEPQMHAWERGKEVARWQGLLGAKRNEFVHVEPAVVDLRIMIGIEMLTIQWRRSADQPFQDLKQTQARKLMNDYEGGSLHLSPEAAILWSAIYKPYDYYTWHNLRHDSPATLKILNRVLRQPTLAERIVTRDGEPLQRPDECLRMEILPADGDDGDYVLRLVRAEGVPVPNVLATLPGTPTLYLTPGAIYSGPQPHGFGSESELVIPAPAIETAAGVGFLAGLGVDLPPRLARRTRPVAYRVNLYCDLMPEAFHSDKDAVFIRAEAVAEGAATEKLHVSGWQTSAASAPAPSRMNGDGELIPIFNRSALQHFPELLDAVGARWDIYQAAWRIRLTRNFAELFVNWLAALPAGIEVHLDRELATLRNNPVSGNVRLDVEESGVDWFDLKVVLNVTDTELTQEELKLLLNARGGYVRLGKKGWRRLQFNLDDEDDQRLAALGLDARDFSAEPQRLHAFQLADAAAKKFLPEEQVEKIHRRASELKARVNPPVPSAIRAELRPYQVEGFHFLAYLTANRFGGVLADDMGLGKTLQTLAWLAWLREETQNSKTKTGNQPALVVCPKSVMDNWRAECERFLPGLRVRLWRGEDADALAKARIEADLIVIHYPHLRALTPEITKLPWHAVILDEAQYIKNPDSLTAQSARALQAEHRLALSGTPIENRLLDLWSILAFAMPGVLGNRAQFTKKFNAADDPLARRRLASRVRPFLLRRTKNQVAKDLPDRIEEDLLCELEGEQKTLYRAEFKRTQQLLLKVKTKQDLNENRFNVLTSLLRLRQICCHPALVNPKLRESDSAKLNALIDLLDPLMEEGHKVLVFSQFVTLLDIVRDTVKARDWPHFYLTGETDDRGELVKEFQNTKGAAVFLISLKAGGFGLNLTAASYVVLFDPWWNPAVEAQAIDRTHRIGQKNKVIAYRLLMKSSIEEKIRALQKTKAASPTTCWARKPSPRASRWKI